ncbi:hypothetical protein ACFPT7_08610 [Acidicapsa dinghuensis]|uniref:Uncharacterized protein n=1 Tax=Acidicapsa dinghuensis TaxID=2218256 RepID=A0ABW1EH80_9BACT|nr:hypothetical protein [Acidicapsa dinghuensis]
MRDLLSNLPRTNEHPTLKTLLEVVDVCSLTLEGVHRLFGYNLEELRSFDFRLNGGRTHIESLHERLRTREVHRPLCVSSSRERERDHRRPYHADHPKQLECGNKVAQSSAGKSDKSTKDGILIEKESAVAGHRHLHRLVSVGICRDHLASPMSHPILPIYRAIIRNYRSVLSEVESDDFFRKRQLNWRLLSRLN